MAKYLRKGTSRIYFLPAISSQTAPTQAELAAGTELTSSVADLAGFNYKSTLIDVPNFGSRQTPKIPGENQSDDSSITIYEDTTTNPLRTTLAKDTTGYMLLFPLASTTSSAKVDVFPVQVSSNTRQWVSTNDAAKFVIDIAITAAVTTDATMGS